jgi:predicted Zn-dependent protease
MRLPSRLTTLALAIALIGCTTTQFRENVEGVLKATGNYNERTRGFLDAGEGALGAVLPMSPEEERAFGGSVAVTSFKEQGAFLENDALQRYVTLVGMAVAARSSRPDLPFRFAVIDRPDVNAWAAPGGYVFITKGALQEMQDEAQLAGVLGHEIAHVTRSHMITMLRRGELQSAANSAVSAWRSDMKQLSSLVGGGVSILFEKGYDREMEYEADLLGMDYAAAAGYDPTGLKRFLEQLNRGAAASKGGGWLESTHPALTDRIDRLRAANQSTYAELENARQPERFRRMVAGLN